MNRLSTRNLCVGYNKKVLIGGICIEIGAGEVVSLIGPNGAGKSTVLKSITRQLESLGGAVYVDGEDSAALSPKSFATRFSVVLTDSSSPASERPAATAYGHDDVKNAVLMTPADETLSPAVDIPYSIFVVSFSASVRLFNTMPRSFILRSA